MTHSVLPRALAGGQGGPLHGRHGRLDRKQRARRAGLDQMIEGRHVSAVKQRMQYFPVGKIPTHQQQTWPFHNFFANRCRARQIRVTFMRKARFAVSRCSISPARKRTQRIEPPSGPLPLAAWCSKQALPKARKRGLAARTTRTSTHNTSRQTTGQQGRRVARLPRQKVYMTNRVRTERRNSPASRPLVPPPALTGVPQSNPARQLRWMPPDWFRPPTGRNGRLVFLQRFA